MCRVVAIFTNIGPVGIFPQLQMLTLLALWVLPMTLHRASIFLLASHAMLACSALDVWIVALAVRAQDMERYSTDASESTCADQGFDTGDQPCFAAVATLQAGYYWLIPPAALQWIVTLAVTVEVLGAIRAARSAAVKSSWRPESIEDTAPVRRPSLIERLSDPTPAPGTDR